MPFEPFIGGEARNGAAAPHPSRASAARRVYAYAVAALLIAAGLALLPGGVSLIGLGGSWYYLISGLVCAATGLLLACRSAWSGRLYALMLLATLIWALWEAGFAAWSLVPRLLLPALLGLLLLPALRHPRAARAHGLGMLGTVALLCLLTLAASFVRPEPGAAAPPARSAFAEASAQWLSYGGDLHGRRFSPHAQITPDNVATLEVAWTHRHGERAEPATAAEATPLQIGDTLYTCTPRSTVIALDARSGEERWRFDPQIEAADYAMRVCRGVAYYRKPGATGACAQRIVSTALDGRLFALDARTGAPCADFGDRGMVSLREHMGVVATRIQYSTSPPTIANGRIVLGGLVLDNQSVDVPSGVIRAYDAVSGALAWAWDMGVPERIGAPQDDAIYTRSTPNAWTAFAADEALNLVYVPLGNPSPDFYGAGRRPFDERYGSAIVALDLDTGRPRWSFQTVHHDLWDYDLPAQPLLADLPTGDGVKPALVQATKRGDLFVLDRRSGEPIVPVTERPVPQGAAPGDHTALTQPYSALRLPAATVTEAGMWGISPFDQLACRVQFLRSRYEGMFTPIGSDRPTIVQPGLTGTVGWGGVSMDADRRILLANTTEFPWRVRLLPRAQAAPVLAKSHWTPAMLGTPYVVDQTPFLGPATVPCLQPPWGHLTAINLDTGQVLWRRPLGSAHDSGPWGQASRLPLTIGTPNQGGSVVTRGGLVFVAGTLDRYLRAFDVNTGRELWKARLPAGAQATPMSYMAGGRQFVLITAGGHYLLGTPPGDYSIAYALPQVPP